LPPRQSVLGTIPGLMSRRNLLAVWVRGSVVARGRVAADKATILRVKVPSYQFVRFGCVAMSRFMENLERSGRVTPCSLRDVNGPAALCLSQR